MSKYLAGRLLQTVPTVFLVTVAVFLMLHLTPGDPAEVFLGDKRSSPELLEKVREDMGLNRPLHVQYLSYMGNALRGDLGRSLQTNVPVMEQILNRLPWTIELAAAALMIAAFIGISVGIIAALYHNTVIDTLAMALALVGISMPVYWSSLLLILLFAVQLRILPAIGQGGIERLILPAAALALVSAGSLARMVRSSMLEVLNQDFVLTARAKGISERLVVIRHVLRNALIPVVTVLGLMLGNMLSGAVITETIFARLGIGQKYVEAVLQKDFTMVQGTTLFIALMYVFVNIVVDIVYAFIDPRIRYV
ncbi:MAG: ABC transporter permease [Chloroflexi bacterium]|nr:ABC transporter permease [Chloroflexota bacterium]